MTTRRALRIGLTGPIACGKSTVAGWLAEAGAVVVDADRVARSVTQPGEPAHDDVLAAFGSRVRAADGTLDRSALATIVFGHPDRLRALERIVHPAVRPRIMGEIAEAEADGATLVAIEAIKLVEGGLAELCDEIWLVTCDPAEQLRRLVARGADEDDAAARMGAQGDIRERLAPASTRVVDTTGSPEEARRRVAVALDRARAELDRGR